MIPHFISQAAFMFCVFYVHFPLVFSQNLEASAKPRVVKQGKSSHEGDPRIKRRGGNTIDWCHGISRSQNEGDSKGRADGGYKARAAHSSSH